jgi:O-acetyl-ADP-ribose deacetylase (regulator of RNase III)
MAITRLIHGDLIEFAKMGAFDLIGHGCNTMNLMGAGIAKFIKEEFPMAFEADRTMHDKYNLRYRDTKPHVECPTMAGRMSHAYVNSGGGFYVANLYTQVYTGRNAKYNHLADALHNLNAFCKENHVQKIGLPMIGCGIGGLNEFAVLNLISSIIEADVTMVIHPDSYPNLSHFEFKTSLPKVYDGILMIDNVGNTFQLNPNSTGLELPLIPITNHKFCPVTLSVTPVNRFVGGYGNFENALRSFDLPYDFLYFFVNPKRDIHKLKRLQSFKNIRWVDVNKI